MGDVRQRLSGERPSWYAFQFESFGRTVLNVFHVPGAAPHRAFALTSVILAALPNSLRERVECQPKYRLESIQLPLARVTGTLACLQRWLVRGVATSEREV